MGSLDRGSHLSLLQVSHRLAGRKFRLRLRSCRLRREERRAGEVLRRRLLARVFRAGQRQSSGPANVPETWICQTQPAFSGPVAAEACKTDATGLPAARQAVPPRPAAPNAAASAGRPAALLIPCPRPCRHSARPSNRPGEPCGCKRTVLGVHPAGLPPGRVMVPADAGSAGAMLALPAQHPDRQTTPPWRRCSPSTAGTEAGRYIAAQRQCAVMLAGRHGGRPLRRFA